MGENGVLKELTEEQMAEEEDGWGELCFGWVGWKIGVLEEGLLDCYGDGGAIGEEEGWPGMCKVGRGKLRCSWGSWPLISRLSQLK